MISSLISKTSSLNLRICRNMHKLKSTASSTDVGGYNHNEYDIKWQEYWDKNQVFLTRRRSPDHPKKYVLDMFPYPSGSGLHVGHPEGYTATDIMARYWRMKDYDVLHPMVGFLIILIVSCFHCFIDLYINLYINLGIDLYTNLLFLRVGIPLDCQQNNTPSTLAHIQLSRHIKTLQHSNVNSSH